jgi:hypothetical protein
MRLGRDLIAREGAHPEGSRSGVVIAEKFPTRNGSGATEAIDAASCFSRWPS